MLRRLHWQLTILYFVAAIGLVGLIGAASYTLLHLYFLETTDQAMQYKMAAEFRNYGVPLTPELAAAEQSWLQNTGRLKPVISNLPPAAQSGEHPEGEEAGEGEEGDEGYAHEAMEGAEEDLFDGSVSAIFVIPYTTNGVRINYPSQVVAPDIADEGAIRSALQNGYDWRTARLGDGPRVRLLTYRTSGTGAPPVIQVGRLLHDQDRVLSQFLMGLLIVGGSISILLGVTSWWLSGRSLRPAQRAWEQQQVFVSNASHELRTPLTLIRATADYGLRSQAGASESDLYQDILQECDYMGRLVDDLLLLSRLDTQRLALKKERILLPGLLEDTRRQVARLAQEKGVELTLNGVEGQVWGDPTRLRQTLLILLENALRFTPPGAGITIETARHGKLVEISVTDQGSGIAPEHLSHVFERFYQVNPNAEGQSRSNGLGLSIAKGLIEAQGGKIQLESQIGKGTRLRVYLPNADV